MSGTLGVGAQWPEGESRGSMVDQSQKMPIRAVPLSSAGKAKPQSATRARDAAAKAERRQLLLNAALDEFYEKGFSAARTEDIAQRVGLSKGTLYLYFPNKEQLFRALIESLTVPNIAALEQITATAPSLRQALETFAQFAPVLVRTSGLPRLMKVLISESQVFPDVITSYRKDVIERILAAFAKLLEVAAARGEITLDDPMITARLVVAPVVLSALWQAVFAQEGVADIDLDSLFQTHVELLLAGPLKGDFP